MIAVEELTLFDFGRESDIARWQPLNDVVMGGHSQSALVPSGHGTALFTGNVSLENYGGFASVRSEPERHDLSTYQGLALHVRGDGRRYQLRVRAIPSDDEVAYARSFDTRAGEWLTLRVLSGEEEGSKPTAVLTDSQICHPCRDIYFRS